MPEINFLVEAIPNLATTPTIAEVGVEKIYATTMSMLSL